MPRIHPLPVLIVLIFSIGLILITTFFSKNSKGKPENFFLGAKNVIEAIIDDKNSNLVFFQKKTKDLNSDFAIYIKDLKTQKIYEYNSSKTFPAASLYKIPVMYTTYNKMKKGQMQKTDELSKPQKELDEILSTSKNIDQTDAASPSPTTSEEETIISYPVSEALRLMVTISDNYAAILLAENLGWSNIDSYMAGEGFSDIDLISEDSPFLNAETIGRLLEKIYSHQAVSYKASEEMLDLLAAQRINDRIPKYLPDSVKIAHKTGELNGVRNDAGIIYGKNSDYIFVFLSQTDDPLQADETIASLTKNFYDQLEK